MTDLTPEPELGELIIQLSKNAEAGFALITTAVIDEWLQKLLLTKIEAAIYYSGRYLPAR